MDQEHYRSSGKRAVAAAVGCALMLGAWNPTLAQTPEFVKPEPTVPEVFTLMGKFVRVAYNKVGFVTLGYQVAQRAVGEEWVLLEVGLTMRSPAKDYKIKREHFTLKTPDGTMIPLASQSDYAKAGHLSALNNRAKVVRDSINYFPADVTRGCSMSFFAHIGQGRRMIAFDEVELSSNRACVGRLYFHVPGGIKYGQHWLHVNFGDSEVQVPFRILTKEEEKQFQDSWEDIKKAHEESYK
jgi:hypothetical protein